MEAEPFVLVAPHSPLAESVALAVVDGVRETGNGAGCRFAQLEDVHVPMDVLRSPLVFLGWREDLATARLAAYLLADELLRTPGQDRHVALFEVVGRGPAPRHDSIRTVAPSDGKRDVQFEGSPEVFFLDHETRGRLAAPSELDRARAWGGQVFGRWGSTERTPPLPAPAQVGPVGGLRTIPWCGATD